MTSDLRDETRHIPVSEVIPSEPHQPITPLPPGKMADHHLAVAIAFLFSGVVGVFFGLYPANKASKLIPFKRCALNDKPCSRRTPAFGLGSLCDS